LSRTPYVEEHVGCQQLNVCIDTPLKCFWRVS